MAETKEFWNIRAKSFPGHRDGDTYQAKMLDVMEKGGVVLDGHTVLDLGCGSGAYTVHMARQAKQVTALDISEVMLDGVRKAAAENGITNIDYVLSDWMDFTPPHKYDIIFTSLTPAVKDEASVDKIRDFAAKWVVNISFTGHMTANVLNWVFDLHNIERSHSKQEPIMRRWLEKHGVPFKAYPVQGEWVTPRTYQAMLDNCIDVIEAHGNTPDIEGIKREMEQFKDEESGMYISKTGYNVEMLIWEV